MTPRDVLREDQRQLLDAARGGGAADLQRLLRRAARELAVRLRELEARGAADTFTAVRMRATLQQIQHVTTGLQRALRSAIVDRSGELAERSAQNLVRYLHAADQAFRGVGQSPLRIDVAALMGAAKNGARTSILARIAHDPQHPGRPGVLERYGVETIRHFEAALQKHVIARTPWPDVRRELTEKSPFLQGAPRSWAERILRTETMYVQNRASHESIRQADEQLGDVLKILSATFDDRTGADSIDVHGQIRRPEEPFETWYGLFEHPPDRPNDREIVVMHRKRWELPPYLRWKSRSLVMARWRAEGRRGKLPPRPLMTTVPLSEIGDVVYG